MKFTLSGLTCVGCLAFWQSTLPAAAQLAANYPNDVGIRNHPAVIYATGFDSQNWQTTDFPTGTRWTYTGGRGVVPTWTGDVAYTGNGCLLHLQQAGTKSPDGILIMGFAGRNEVYMRWYRMYQDGYRWGCQSAKNNGVYAVADPSGSTEACIQPTGYDKYSFRVQDEARGSSGGQPGDFFGALYYYHPHANNGGCGAWSSQNQNGVQYQQPGRWYCYEIYLRANAVGRSDGVIKMWVDGQLRGHYEGIEFRLVDSLKINQVYLYGSTGGCDTPYTQKVWDDNLVLATEYIGPVVTSPSAKPAPPTRLRVVSTSP